SVDIRIFDVQGGVVGTFHNASGQLDISHLPSGLYIIELSAGKQKSYQRIVKMD
ncbi:MAG: T9SS type A sorting domain-containing protein, partial [Saprospiraceae bacterium]|nr:T9SS type A sorting domain-containing protein [Saprospiraceae bacterium]